MYEIIKEKSIDGYIVPEIIDEELGNMLSDICNINRENKYDISCYSKANKNHIMRSIKRLFGNGIVEYNDNEIFYSLYYLPNNMFKIWVPLTDLLYRKLLPNDLYVLELGCGPGTSTFGLLEFYREMALNQPQQKFTIKIDVVEKQPKFIAIFKEILQEYLRSLPQNLTVLLRNAICAEITSDFTFLNNTKYSIIYASNVFNINEKLGDRYFQDCCKNLNQHLLEESSMIFIEPGERSISTVFKRARNKVETQCGLHIYSPCCCHFRQEHTRCEQFAVAHIRNIQSKVLDLLDHFGISSANRRTHSFDYVVFRNDGLNKYNPTLKHRTKLCDVDWTQKGKRVNIVAGVLSANVKCEKVGLQLCDGTVQEKAWLNISSDDVEVHGINIDIIRGERIDLIGAIIDEPNKLAIDQNTEIRVSY